MCRVFVKSVLYVCTVIATTCDSSASIAKIGAGIASALAVYIVADFALQANADSAVGCVLEASSIAINTGIVTHVGDIVASKCLASRVYRILSKILHFITLYARPCPFIAT